ncbi:tRNA (cytidine(56)-2'-O)-methyltransferase [archaeon]|nr:tRNA (cytidine(56)-2'-O)-methyltransferase [archaeon]
MVEVLRLSHRIRRDPRISTHLCLVSRAFLADKLYYSGDRDQGMEKVVSKVNKDFGGNFEVNYVDDVVKLIKEKKKNGFKIVHLTVYGLKLNKEISKIRKHKKVLILVGGEKVEPIFYKLSDYNISVTNQPHSEVAGLAVFLNYYNKGKEFNAKFKGKINIKPSKNKKEFK